MTTPAAESSPSQASASSQRVLEARGLRKVYGKRTVVDGVDISLRSGEVVGLLGPNGAGKTTTFYMIVGLVPATGGQVMLDGADITPKPMYRRARSGLGYLAQEHSVFGKLTVWENLMAVAETLKLNPKERRERVEKHLEELHLTHLARQKAFTLSGGEKRRLEISRALVTQPGFLLLDEPFAGVDPISVAEVQGMIRDMRKRGLGVLITDHQVRETLGVVDRAYILAGGRVICEGTSDFLITDPEARRLYLGDNFKL